MMLQIKKTKTLKNQKMMNRNEIKSTNKCVNYWFIKHVLRVINTNSLAYQHAQCSFISSITINKSLECLSTKWKYDLHHNRHSIWIEYETIC